LDVTSFLAQGYDDALPLIVSTVGTAAARTADKLSPFAEQDAPITRTE
jgi:hypothetical protein